MTSLGSFATQAVMSQLAPALNALLQQMAAPMTPSVDKLINQLIPLKATTGGQLLAAARAGVLDAVVLASNPAGKPGNATAATNSSNVTGNNAAAAQFIVTIKVQQQVYQLTTAAALTVGTRLQLSIAPNNQAVIISIDDPARTGAAPPPDTRNRPTPPIRQPAAPQSPPATNITASTPPPADNSPLIAQGLRQALPVQQPLQALLPLLQQVVNEPPAQWPKALTHNLKVLLQQFPSPAQLQQPQTLQQVIKNTGLFFEARLAQQPGPATPDNAPSPASARRAAPINYDIKGLLQRLIPQLQKAQSSASTSAHPAAAANATATTQATPRPTLPGAIPANAAPQPQTQDSAPTSYHPQTLPELLLSGKPSPRQSTGNSDKAADVLLKQLGNQLLASLARSQLNQLETLANRQQHSPDSPAPATSWTLEIPVLQGSTVDNITLRIDQQSVEDRDSAATSTDKTLWTVMLAFDLHQLGKMNVQLKVVDNTVSATVWSEQQHTHREVQQQVKQLEQQLQKIGVHVRHIDCQLGLPTQTAAPLYRQLVDIHT